MVGDHVGDLRVHDDAAAGVGVAGAEDALHVAAAEVLRRLGVVRAHEPPLHAEGLDGGAVVPHQHEHAHAVARLALQELAESGVTAGARPCAVPQQRDLGVHRPAGDIDQVARVADGVEHVLPAPALLVAPAAGERDPGRERVGRVRVLVQRDPAPGPL
uniref:Uncharacterized protein n=1 Tax=Arundo donax TaxID=35708 RepID=A0A0A9DEH3_ARUDO